MDKAAAAVVYPNPKPYRWVWNGQPCKMIFKGRHGVSHVVEFRSGKRVVACPIQFEKENPAIAESDSDTDTRNVRKV